MDDSILHATEGAIKSKSSVIQTRCAVVPLSYSPLNPPKYFLFWVDVTMHQAFAPAVAECSALLCGYQMHLFPIQTIYWAVSHKRAYKAANGCCQGGDGEGALGRISSPSAGDRNFHQTWWIQEKVHSWLIENSTEAPRGRLFCQIRIEFIPLEMGETL